MPTTCGKHGRRKVAVLAGGFNFAGVPLVWIGRWTLLPCHRLFIQPNRTASSTPARPTFFPRSWRLSLGTGDLDRNRDTPVALHNRSSSRRRRTSTNRYQSQLFWPSGHSAYQLEKRTNIPAAFFASRFAVDGG